MNRYPACAALSLWRCQGQALPLALLLAAAAGVAWVHMAGLGAVAAARGRLTHTADAVVYSGALAQARALNLLATINRAQMAHQVGMAHLTTLAAWAQHGHAQSQRAGRGNPPATVIGMLFGPSYALAYSAAGGARSFGSLAGPQGGLGQAQARHEHAVHQVLDLARRAIVAGMPDERQAIMGQVLAANYREQDHADAASAASGMPLPELDILHDNLQGFIANHAASPRGSLRGAVEDAVAPYAFLKPRNRTARNPWPVSGRCPWLRHELRRRGVTEFDLSGRWQAHDTLSYHALRSNRYVGCYFREYPMGWGQATTRQAADPGFVFHDDPPQDFSEQDFWRWVRSATDWGLLDGLDNRLANSYAVRDGVRRAAAGLPGFSDLRRGPRANEPVLRLSVRLRQDAGTIAAPGLASVAHTAGRYAFDALASHDAVTVRAAAETFFARPHARSDGWQESPSLFHPYWQARLVAEPRQ